MSASGQSTAEALRQCEAELGLQTEALAHFSQVAASRELRVLQLEQEVNELCQRQGKAARYPLRFEPDTRLTPAEPLGDDAMPMAQTLEKLSVQLRESEERYRLLLESLAEGYCVIEKVGGEAGELLDFRYVETNPAFAAQTGLSDVLGKTLRQVLPNEFEERIRTYDAVHKTGEAVRFQREFVTHGRVLELYAFRAADKPHGRVAINLHDVTERKQAEQRLRQNHDTFFNLIENAPFGLYVVDAQFRLCQVSTASRKVFSHIDPLIGRDFEEVLRLVWAEPFVSEALGHFRHTLQTGEPYAAPNTTAPRQNIPDIESYDWKIERIALPDGQHGVVCYFYDITERMQAQEALRESEERLLALVTASTDMTYSMSPDWSEIRQLNGKTFITDLPATGGNWIEQLLLPEDRPQVLGAINDAIQTRTIFSLEHRIRRVDGSLGWTLSRAVPLLDANGDIVEWFGTASDVTEEKRTEQALRESEERYRSLFTSIDEGFCIIEMIFDAHEKPVDYRFLEVNPAFEQLTGLRDATGKRMRELVPDHDQLWFEIYGRVALTGEARRFVNEAKAMDTRWFDVYATRLGEPESRKVALLFSNITERKKAEEALRDSEERLRLAAEAAHFGIYDRDLGGAYFHVSGQLKQMLGYEPDAPLGHEEVMSHFHLEDQPAGLSAFKYACDPAGDGHIAVEQRIVRRDGTVRWISNVGRVLFEDGVPKRSIGFWVDITERSRLERETLALAHALTELDRRKDEFLAMLGHELRNPLAALANAAQLLRRQEHEDASLKQCRSIIERQIGQLKHLVDDLLEVSRITTGSVRLRQEQIALSGIVERAVETAQPLIRQHKHLLKVSLPLAPVLLFADAARLEQVLVNLLTNAAKYTDEGGRIWLGVEPDKAPEGVANGAAMVVIRVRDTGIGIAPELLPRIFDLFTQADRSLDRSQGGLGIGLCLVQRLVELHGGTVEAHSVVGQGSEFVVRLPLMPTPLPATPTFPLPDPDTPLPPEKAATGCRVLVVDDNVDAAQSLAILLEIAGYEVRLAYDGPSALQAAIDYGPDVALLDIGLPGLDGFEVAQRIRRQPALKGMVLVALTGYGQDADRQRSKEVGFDYHLVKPAAFDEIEKILADVQGAAR